MDTLENQLLMRDLDKYGYNLVQVEPSDAANTLTRMLKSDDGRLLEGVPVVLTNVLMHEQQALVLKDFEKNLPSALQRRFRTLAAVTYFFLFWVPVPQSESVRTELLHYLKEREPSLLEQVQNNLNSDLSFNMGNGVKLDAQRLQNTYKNYVVARFLQVEENLAKKLDEQRQDTFLGALSELFTERQRSLLFKLLNKEQLTKTEREYYSRTVKPRLKALRNPDLQSFVSTLLSS